MSADLLPSSPPLSFAVVEAATVLVILEEEDAEGSSALVLAANAAAADIDAAKLSVSRKVASSS